MTDQDDLLEQIAVECPLTKATIVVKSGLVSPERAR